MGKIALLAERDVGTRLKLRLMATTDLHMQVLAQDPLEMPEGRRREAKWHGFARTASLIRAARSEAANALLLDNGDFLCGNGFDSLPQATWRRAHPMIEIMNHLGYDAATVGNHDFDHGYDYLEAVIRQARFPFVSANILQCAIQPDAAARPLFQPFAILQRDLTDQHGRMRGVMIGVTGFLPPGSIPSHPGGSTDAAGKPGPGPAITPPSLRTRDIIAAARQVVPEMRAAGADVIIALAHTGLGEARHVYNMENAAVPLAAVEGIDAVISGHRHQVFPGPGGADATLEQALTDGKAVIDAKAGTVHGKPVVAAGFWGSHLGVIDLELEYGKLENGQTGWRVRQHRVEARAVARRSQENPAAKPRTTEQDDRVLRIFSPAHQRITNSLGQPLGRIARPLHSFFALAAPSPAMQIVQHAQVWYVRERLEPGAASADPALPLLSSACAFRVGGYGGPDNFTDIAPGQVTLSAIAGLYPFPNHLALVEIDGAGLREWLERAASVFNRARTGQPFAAPSGLSGPGPAPTYLKAPETPAYLFETVLGVDYSIDLSQPARYDQAGRVLEPGHRRIAGLSHNGRPVRDDARFLLITNTHRQTRGGNYPLAATARRLKLPNIRMQQVLGDYFAAHPLLDLPLTPHWRFAPLPGARMRFRSSPAALLHLFDMPGGLLQPAGQDDEGYQLFDLNL